MDISISDTLIILATISGPIMAVQVQKRLEVWREKRNRKLGIFYNLMATRASRVSERHVEALNSIQLEYHSVKKTEGKKVKDAWAEYHNHLNEPQGDSPDDLKRWNEAGDELFINMLFEMSQFLGYDYSRVDLKKGAYSPIGLGNRNLISEKISLGLAAVLTGEKPLAVKLKGGIAESSAKPLNPPD